MLYTCFLLMITALRQRRYSAGPPYREKGTSATFKLPLAGYADGESDTPVTITVLGRTGEPRFAHGRSGEEAGSWWLEQGSAGIQSNYGATAYSPHFEPEPTPSMPSFGAIPTRSVGRESMITGDVGGGDGGMGAGSGAGGGITLLPQMPEVRLSWGRPQ